MVNVLPKFAIGMHHIASKTSFLPCVLIWISVGKICEPRFCQKFETSRLGHECPAQTFRNIPFADNASEICNCACTTGNTDVWVLQSMVDVIRDNPPASRSGKANHFCLGNVFFVQDRIQHRTLHDSLKDSVFCLVELICRFRIAAQVKQRPHLNLRHFGGVEDIHGNRVCALVGQVAANTGTQPAAVWPT